MFFIDDDQTQVVERCEHPGPRADHHVDLAPANSVPLVVALTIGESTVLHSDPSITGGPKRTHDSRRERDLGNQHKNPTSLTPHLAG